MVAQAIPKSIPGVIRVCDGVRGNLRVGIATDTKREVEETWREEAVKEAEKIEQQLYLRTWPSSSNETHKVRRKTKLIAWQCVAGDGVRAAANRICQEGEE